jgi:hypothetical protein
MTKLIQFFESGNIFDKKKNRKSESREKSTPIKKWIMDHCHPARSPEWAQAV